jgi:hypothetical protein
MPHRPTDHLDDAPELAMLEDNLTARQEADGIMIAETGARKRISRSPCPPGNARLRMHIPAS